MRAHHQPIRTCVACRGTSDKRTMMRVVRTPDGPVAYDPTGKANGRGAYVCAAEECIRSAMKRKALDRSLKATVQPDLFDVLLAAVTPEPPGS